MDRVIAPSEEPMHPLIAGNWKMHGSGPQLGEIGAVAALVEAEPLLADVLICVPPTLVFRAAQTAAGRIAIGGEDCHAQVAGAFTGDVSAEMLVDAGATAVIVGHSERRRYHHETDAMVAAKATAAQRSGLSMIICIGETTAERHDAKALCVCSSQIEGSLPKTLARPAATSVAYEPLWAIGSGHMSTAGEIADVHLHIRSCLVARLGPEGKKVRILYGGSVEAANIGPILDAPEVGGVLIGGASLKAADFDAVLGVVRGQARPS